MLGRALARQGSRPSGLIGRVTGHFLNRETQLSNDLALRMLEPEPGSEILEIGFGGGRALRHLLSMDPKRVTGVELSSTMVSEARRHFRTEIEAGRLQLAEGSADELPYPDAAFDRALSVNTIYFWPDPATGLGELRRVLRAGGRLVIGTNSKEHMEARWFAKYGFHRLFDNEELRGLLERAGFANVRSVEDGHAVATIGERPSG